MKTKNLLIALLMMLCISSIASAQITFQKAYGGIGVDWGYSVQQTMDGGYIIAGRISSFGAGSDDVYLIKTNSNGDTLWTKTLGGANIDWGFSVKQTIDSGYIIAGETKSFGTGGYDVYLVKMASNGTILWTKTYGGASYDIGYSVQQNIDGGYIIAGYTLSFGYGQNDVYLIKTDDNGNILWSKTFGGIANDGGQSVQQTFDRGYVIAGYSLSFGFGSDDFYLIKTDSNGSALWSKTYGGIGYDYCKSVIQTPDSGYIMAGTTSSFGAGGYDIYLIKTLDNGDTLWAKTFGGTNDDWGDDVQQTFDGGLIVVGHTASFGADSMDVYLIKTTSSGDTIWTKTFGGISNDGGYSVQQTSDGGYIITGPTSSFGVGDRDVYLIKTDANGNSIGCFQGNSTTIIGTTATVVTNPSTIEASPATIVTIPTSIVGSGCTVTPLCITTSINANELEEENSLTIFPNPVADNLTIETPQKATIEIISIQGQLVKTLTTTEDKISVDVSGLPGGVYMVEVKTAERLDVKKFIKE